MSTTLWEFNNIKRRSPEKKGSPNPKMLSLPVLGTSQTFLPTNDIDLHEKNESLRQWFCETQIDEFTCIPLRTGTSESTDPNQTLTTLSSASKTPRTREHEEEEDLNSQTDLREATVISATGDSFFDFLGQPDKRHAKLVKPLDKYFASFENETLKHYRGPDYERKFTEDTTKRVLKGRNGLYSEGKVQKCSEDNEGINVSARTLPVFLRNCYHGNTCGIKYGDIFRDMVGKTERQYKEKAKIIHDNVIAEQKLKDANMTIEILTDKIKRRRHTLKCKEESQQKLLENIDSLEKERDEKRVECNKLMAHLKDGITERRNKIDELAKRRIKSEASYHQELQNNIELKTKLESKERHLKALKEKVEKARKWKNDIV